MMRFAIITPARSWILACALTGLLLAFGPHEALARDPAGFTESGAEFPSTPTTRPHPSRERGLYFVEFRSRYALSYGHTFLVHGRLNARGEVGQVTAEQVAGLHPAGEGPQLWSMGHVVPVPAETGPSDGDMEDQYISNRFRVVMDEAQYRRVYAYIKRKQRTSTMWHAVMNNCNRWVGEIATYMGLKAPDNTLLYPAEYISALRNINSRRSLEPQFSSHGNQ
jgi:hypothetical protein